MAGNMPVKLVLKGTSSMSLNERFEKLPKLQPGTNQNRQQQLQQARIQEFKASAKNRRLAAQMANRPSVLQALSSTSQNLNTPQRFRGRGGRGRGFNRARSNLTLRGRGASQAAVVSPVSDVKQRLGIKPGARGALSSSFRGKLRGRPVSSVRGRGLVAKSNLQGRGRGRGRGRGSVNQSVRGNLRGKQGGRLRRGGRGRGRGQATPVDRSALDQELDAYMAQSNME